MGNREAGSWQQCCRAYSGIRVQFSKICTLIIITAQPALVGTEDEETRPRSRPHTWTHAPQVSNVFFNVFLNVFFIIFFRARIGLAFTG